MFTRRLGLVVMHAQLIELRVREEMVLQQCAGEGGMRLARRYADKWRERRDDVAECCLVLLSLRGRAGGEDGEVVVRRKRRRSAAGAGVGTAEGVGGDAVEDRTRHHHIHLHVLLFLDGFPPLTRTLPRTRRDGGVHWAGGDGDYGISCVSSIIRSLRSSTN